MNPIVICPDCHAQEKLDSVLTAQSNQNVIYRCKKCGCEIRDIQTSKG
ncbi:hypothetical protein ACFFJY_12430 [Fictibacillus aquaticus]|nr:hypothetical protein [Fictibacillus aquaticus]